MEGSDSLRTDTPPDEEEPVAPATGGRGLQLLMSLAALSVCGAVVAVVVARNRQPEGPSVEERIAQSKLDDAEAAIEEGDWAGALGGLEALTEGRADDDPVLEQAARLAERAYQGRVRGAFLAYDVARARSLLPDGWEAWSDAPDELVWVLALTGSPGEALARCAPDVPPAARARLAAWARKPEACVEALQQLAPDHARALAWELRAYMPWLAAEAQELGERPSPTASPWALAARGEQALAQGLTGLAAVDFEAGRAAARSAPEARLANLLGLARVHLARGEAAKAATRLVDAFGVALHPLDRARCLGWGLQVLDVLGEAHEGLDLQAGGDLRAEAYEFAPGSPLVQAGAWRERLRKEWSEDALAEDAPGASPMASTRGLARRAPYSLAEAPFPTPATSWLSAEPWLCAQGEDGPGGILVGRALVLAQAAWEGNDRRGAEQAREWARAACVLRPDSPSAWRARALASAVLRQAEAAGTAAERMMRLAPEDPLAWWTLGWIRSAGLDALRLEADRACAGGAPDASVEARLVERLGEVRAAFAGARERASELPELAARARLGEAWAAAEQARRARAAGQDATPWWAQAQEALTPLLPEDAVEAVVAARGQLARGLAQGDAATVAAAEDALAEAARGVGPAQRQALWLASGWEGPRAVSYAKAFLGVAGDLPGRALAAVRGAEGAEALERAGARALALDPESAAGLIARGVAAGAGSTTASWLQLARGLARHPESYYAIFGALYFSEVRVPVEEIESRLELGKGPEGEVRLARALARRVVNVFPRDTNGLDPERRLELTARHDSLSRQAVLDARAAWAAGERGAGAHTVLAACWSTVGVGAAPNARPDPLVLPDVLFHLGVARARAPWCGAVLLLHLHWAEDRVTEVVGELLAHGFLTNYTALKAHPGIRDRVDGVIRPVVGVIQELDVRDRQAVARALEVAQGLPALAPLAWTLRTWLLEERPEGTSELPVGTIAEVEAAQVSASAEARLELSLALADASGRSRAAGSAARAALRAQPPGRSGWGPLGRLGARGVYAPLEGAAVNAETVEQLTLPAQRGVYDVWYRLLHPERALAWLSGLEGAEGPEFGSGRVFGDLGRRWSRSRVLLWGVQEADLQREAAAWLAAGGEQGEAELARGRARAFDREEFAGSD